MYLVAIVLYMWWFGDIYDYDMVVIIVTLEYYYVLFRIDSVEEQVDYS